MEQLARAEKLRALGLTPTIQRLAILKYLENTTSHPTADQVLAHVQREFPTMSRATVYNTLEALTKVGGILRITVDPSVARYDADVGPHIHFRCRICGTVYDIAMDQETNLDEYVDGHHVESTRTYAYGVCSACSDKTNARRASKATITRPSRRKDND
jgi:Fur family transcriptional regulator, peroxide stress response regulator